MESYVPDSQIQHMDWVSDSQMQGGDHDEHSDNLRVFLHSIIGVISSLVMFLSQTQDTRNEWRGGPQVWTEIENEDPMSFCRRAISAWRQFIELNVTVTRVHQVECQCSPMRRITCPWYIKPRTIEWFYLYIDWSPARDPERFREFFRVSPALFVQICNLVRQDMLSHAPQSFHSLPNRNLIVERQVAVAMRRLATGDQLLGIGELFGLSNSTASKVTWRFIKSFSRRGRHFLRWPQPPAMEEVKAGFMQRWGFPNCCGAIDVTHFIIELPGNENSTAYYDWRHNLSVSMQAVVDYKGKFMDVLIGTPGSVQDSRVLRMSHLYHNVIYDRTKLHGPDTRMENGYMLREYLLGDAGYPLYNWLIVPFNKGQSVATNRFNTQHSSARMCVERSFGKLKGMWRILSRVIFRPRIERLASTILTCVLLHNMRWSKVKSLPLRSGMLYLPTRRAMSSGTEGTRRCLLEGHRLDRLSWQTLLPRWLANYCHIEYKLMSSS